MNRPHSDSNASDLTFVSVPVLEQPNALSLGSGASVSAAALSLARDSLRVLSAFAWGKESRLSKKKSAQLCDLMNAWN